MAHDRDKWQRLWIHMKPRRLSNAAHGVTRLWDFWLAKVEVSQAIFPTLRALDFVNFVTLCHIFRVKCQTCLSLAGPSSTGEKKNLLLSHTIFSRRPALCSHPNVESRFPSPKSVFNIRITIRSCAHRLKRCPQRGDARVTSLGPQVLASFADMAMEVNLCCAILQNYKSSQNEVSLTQRKDREKGTLQHVRNFSFRSVPKIQMLHRDCVSRTTRSPGCHCRQ